MTIGQLVSDDLKENFLHNGQTDSFYMKKKNLATFNEKAELLPLIKI